jgi:ribose transport system substrate-binding protein
VQLDSGRHVLDGPGGPRVVSGFCEGSAKWRAARRFGEVCLPVIIATYLVQPYGDQIYPDLYRDGQYILMRRARRMIIPLTVAATIFAGCGGSSKTASSSTASTASNTTGTSGAAPATSSSASGKKYTIGLVPFSSADPTSNQAMVAVEDVAKKNGWHFSLIDAQGAPDKAISAIQNLVQKKVDLIITTVFPADSLAGGVLAAKAAGIPVASLGGGTGNGVQSNWDVGLQQGKVIAAKMIADTGGQGDLLVLGYKPGLPCQEREAALDAAIKSTSLKVTRQEIPIPGQVQGGLQDTQAWLASHPAGSTKDTIWACFDDPAIGAISALQQAGRHDVAVYGINGTPQALQAIRSGAMVATVWINAFGAGTQMGDAIPQLVANGVSGTKTVERSAPSVLVDKTNLDQFLKQYPSAANGQ